MAYIEISLEDFLKFFKTRYRAYKPTEVKKDKGEYVYDLFLTKTVTVRVHTSIMRSGKSAKRGQDAIRTILFAPKINRPLNKKVAPSIVKRTPSWKKSLSDRIDSFVEEYYNKEDFYNALSVGKKPEEKKVEPPATIEIKKDPPPKKVGKGSDQFVDDFGNFEPDDEYKNKYINAIEKMLDELGNKMPSYFFDLLESVKNQMASKGKWSAKQKATVDKALKRNKLMTMVATAKLIEELI